MGNGLCFDTGRDMPPGMQEKMATKVIADLQKKNGVFSDDDIQRAQARQIQKLWAEDRLQHMKDLQELQDGQEQPVEPVKDEVQCPYCGTLMQLTDQPEATQDEMVTDWFFVCAACGSRSPIIHVENPMARIFNVAEMIHKAFPMEGIEWRPVEPGEELG